MTHSTLEGSTWTALRPPSWDGSDEVDIETIAILVEIPMGINMVTSFKMKL